MSKYIRKTPLKTVLIDLSGTLHIDNYAIPGAVEALKRLRSSKLKVKFVTNTTKESRRILHQRLVHLGFDVKADDIFSSLSAAHALIKSKNLSPMLIIDDAALEDFTDVLPPEGSELDAVVIGLAPEKFNYEELTKAFRLLTTGAQLIAIHEARYFKRSDGLALGPGAFVKGLEYSADCKAHVVGKPTAEFFKAALDGIDPESAIMIGDDARDDIGGAQDIGMDGFLVQTGKYRNGDEEKISPPPSRICPSFSEAVDEILQSIQSKFC